MSDMLLYKNYIKERQGAEMIVRDDAFASYKIVKNELFICDMFVEQGRRQSGVGAALIKSLLKIGAEASCEFISGNISLADPNANHTLIASLSVGFHVVSANAGVLTIVRKIEGEK